MGENIAAILLRYAVAMPDAIAANADGVDLTYAELSQFSMRLAGILRERRVKRLAIIGSRSLGAFIGVLGSYWAGTTYVPLSLKAPRLRLVDMLRQTKCEAVLLDRRGAALYGDDLAAAGPGLVIIGDPVIGTEINVRGPEIWHLIDVPDVSIAPTEVANDHPAYIIFTSGTTGSPKGVVIPNSAVRGLLEVLQRRYDIGPGDRVAETADLSFDLSVGNMLLAWGTGAALYATQQMELVAPAQFIRSKDITVWFSVPSIIALAQRTGALLPGAFPRLRYSLFIGEPLSVAAAQAWQLAAPNSQVENLYGPTEATVACTGQILDGMVYGEGADGMVSIGVPFDGVDAAVLDPAMRVVPPGTPGQLALSGRQLALGYLDRDDLTAERFPLLDGRRWYLTGDAAYEDEAGRFHHLGRIDNQIKVRGYRVELEEVESHLRACCRSTAAAVVGWPEVAGSIEGLVGFVVADPETAASARRALKEIVPSYMVPSAVYVLDALPMSDKGKIDRAALIRMLDAGYGA